MDEIEGRRTDMVAFLNITRDPVTPLIFSDSFNFIPLHIDPLHINHAPHTALYFVKSHTAPTAAPHSRRLQTAVAATATRPQRLPFTCSLPSLSFPITRLATVQPTLPALSPLRSPWNRVPAITAQT